MSNGTQRRAPDLFHPKKEEPRMHEMVDYHIWKERRAEVVREVELDRLAKRVRAARKGRAGRTSLLAWELKRGAGRFLKFLRTLNGVR